MEHVNGLKAAIAAVVAVLTAWWGWMGWLVVGWFAAMLIDYFTGSAAAISRGEWSSNVARKGLWRKAGCMAAVAAAGLVDAVLGHLLTDVAGNALPFTYTVFLCPLALVWYILTEAGSIVENAGDMGAPIPAWLKKAIAALKDKVDNSADESEVATSEQSDG